MRFFKFKPQTCEQVRSCLDSYLNGELLVETNHDIQRHLESCRGCAVEVESRLRLRSALQQAVESEPVPSVLAAKVREGIRANQPVGMFSLTSGRLSVAAALLIVLCLGTWVTFSTWSKGKTSDQILQAELNPSLSEGARRILNVGLSDHINCAIEDENTNRYFGTMQPEYAALLPLIKEKIGAGYEMVAAHHCEIEGREFAHVILTKGDATLSLAITKKNGESFTDHAPASTSNLSGVSLYQGHSPHYQIAGFEAGANFAFIVSNLPQDENLRIASTLAPPVRDSFSRSIALAQF
ncbi:MAG: zf-HC2 domain-containing protein [Acidobacteriota bacterium]|nr:zf-HC2 domain-containing protein [Acidobacteriota bacterium]